MWTSALRLRVAHRCTRMTMHDHTGVFPSSARAFIPALFCHGADDKFIAVHHSRQMCVLYSMLVWTPAAVDVTVPLCYPVCPFCCSYDAYAGDKNLVVVDGDHNSARPPFFQHSASIFLRTALRVPDAVRCCAAVIVYKGGGGV